MLRWQVSREKSRRQLCVSSLIQLYLNTNNDDAYLFTYSRARDFQQIIMLKNIDSIMFLSLVFYFK